MPTFLDPSEKPPILILSGPTAVGKTEISLLLARKINAEIISCDSMQIYKGMDIITSKPGKAMRKAVPHYLLDFVDPKKEYNVAWFRREALKKIKLVLKKKKIPLLVGGTGLYITMLVDGIFAVKSEDVKIREKLYKEAECQGSDHLYLKLQKIDPAAATKIHPHDTKRIVRALEVYETTGKPISLLQQQRKGLARKYNVKMFCLSMERQRLYERINARVEEMFKAGVLEEVRKLLKFHLSRTASCALGIKELKGYFEGVYSLDEAKALMQKNTRNYAKRQLTWFRKDKRVLWVDMGECDKPPVIVKRIIGMMKG